MITFIDKCRNRYSSRIGKKGFRYLTLAELEKGEEEIWYNIQPVSLDKNDTMSFVILAPHPRTMKLYRPLSYWTEPHHSAAQHLSLRPGAELHAFFRELFVDENSESYDDIHKEGCIGVPFTATTAAPVKIRMQRAGGTVMVAKGVAMFVGKKVLHESEDDCDEGDFHFEEQEDLGVVCQANQDLNAPFSEDPAANNGLNIPLIASIMKKRLTADDLKLVVQSKTKNNTTVSPDIDELLGHAGEEAGIGIAVSADVNQGNATQSSAEESTKGTKRKTAQINPEPPSSTSSQ
jgi:hypothetical protein